MHRDDWPRSRKSYLCFETETTEETLNPYHGSEWIDNVASWYPRLAELILHVFGPTQPVTISNRHIGLAGSRGKAAVEGETAWEREKREGAAVGAFHTIQDSVQGVFDRCIAELVEQQRAQERVGWSRRDVTHLVEAGKGADTA